MFGQSTRWTITAFLSPLALIAHGAALLNASEGVINSDAIRLEPNIRIPLRDGVRLSATRYVPTATDTVPLCVVSVTPYIADHYHARGVYFAAHGITFIMVDARGRGESEGQFIPFLQEAKDGFDVVEWLAKQPYCHEAVAMWGGSYGGYSQWATAKEKPPHLVSIVPASAPYLGVDFPMQKNIFSAFDVRWLAYTEGHASHPEIYGDDSLWAGIYRRWAESGLPFREFDSFAGFPSAVFQSWTSHPSEDDFWDSFGPTSAQFSQMQIPILTITGAYDDDQLGALTYYRRHVVAQNGTPSPHFLVIGPWDHLGTRTPRREFDGASFGPASIVDLPKLHVDWYNWIIHRGPRPKFLQDKVAYYVAGAEEWRYAPTLEAVTAEMQPFYLDAETNAVDVFHSGVLRPALRGHGAPDRFEYYPRLARQESEDSGSVSLTSQRDVLSSSMPKLVYHTEPLEQSTNISGFFRFSAWIAIDQPDTDFVVRIYALDPDGSSLLLTFDTLRARYRVSPRFPVMVTSRAPQLYKFEAFNFVSRQLRKGSRLRLTLSPIDSVDSERNYNGGGVVANELGKDAHAVRVRVFHDAAHPTSLYVPIGRLAPASGA